ncbi:MAG: hypothetical protein KAI81_05885, partial [Candidatus Marinimicrobia bacterium]|nr:hypothetical protein [Candidatus Neomarinimicrobiota bacterium]
MKKLFLFIVTFTILSAGEYADAFLQTSLPASSLAMGRSMMTHLQGLASVPGNPAGLAQINKTQTMIQYANMFDMATNQGLAFSTPLGKNTQLAISWYRSSVNDIPIRPALDDSLNFLERRSFLREHFGKSWESFSDQEDVLYFTIAKYYKLSKRPGWAYDPIHLQIPVAVNFKYLHKNTYDNTASGMGMDIAAKIIIPGNEIFYVRHLGDFEFGFSLHDVYVSGLYWDTGHVDLVKMA